MTTIALASSLRGWVYPLLLSPISIPGDRSRLIGVVNQEGTFILNPAISEPDFEQIEADFRGVLDDEKRLGMHNLNEAISAYGTIDRNVLRGRTVVLVSDILTEKTQLKAVEDILKPIVTKDLLGMVGNVEVNVADMLHLQTNSSQFMDVMPITFNDEHYFEKEDEYSMEEKRKLASNISRYWAS